MFTLENKMKNVCSISMCERMMEAVSDELSSALVESLQSNNNSILLAEDSRVQTCIDDDTDIVVHGLVYNEEKEDVLCYYHLLDTPEYENTCSITETSLDLIEVLQAINDTFDNDPETM